MKSSIWKALAELSELIDPAKKEAFEAWREKWVVTIGKSTTTNLIRTISEREAMRGNARHIIGNAIGRKIMDAGFISFDEREEQFTLNLTGRIHLIANREELEL